VLLPRRRVEHGDGGVEVVEARVHESQRDDLAVEDAGELLVRERVAAEAGAREDRPSDEEEVALALVDLGGLAHVETGLAEPVHVGGTLGLPLRVGELGAVGDAVDDEPAVRGVDHVGQAGDGIDELHVVAQADVGVVEQLPLLERQVRVGRLRGVHPGVDPVDDGEVLWAAHQYASAGRAALGPRARLLIGLDHGRHLTPRGVCGCRGALGRVTSALDISTVGDIGGPGRSSEPRRRRSGCGAVETPLSV
jgi:hypothetical protein